MGRKDFCSITVRLNGCWLWLARSVLTLP